MTDLETPSLKDERQHLQYRGNVIPRFVRLIWICFWGFAIYYAVQYFLPALQQSWQTPS